MPGEPEQGRRLAGEGPGAAAGRGLGRSARIRVAGIVVALRRRHPYDVFWMHGQAEEIARDTLFRGTALSAPVSNLVLQAALTAGAAARPSRRTQQALGALGALWVAGYLGERLVRQRLGPSGWERLESPLLVVAIGLAVAMAALGLGTPAGLRGGT